MTASNLVYALLSQNPTVVGLVGTSVFPVMVPQGKDSPYLVYQLVTRSTQRLRGCDQPTQATIQVTTYATDYDLMEEVETAALLALDGYQNGEAYIEQAGAVDGFEEQVQLFSRTTDYRVIVPALSTVS